MSAKFPHFLMMQNHNNIMQQHLQSPGFVILPALVGCESQESLVGQNTCTKETLQVLAGDMQRILAPELALPLMRVVGLNTSVLKRTLVPEVYFHFSRGILQFLKEEHG